MTLIDDTTLAAARDALEQLHVTSAVHTRPAESVAADGSVSLSWSTIATINCRVETDMGTMEQSSTRGAEPADRVVHEYVVYTAHDADVRTGDRLTLASGIVLSVAQASRAQSQAFVQALYCTEPTA